MLSEYNTTVDLITGEIISTREAGGSLAGVPVTLVDDLPLSTAHISPFIEWPSGASLLKVSKAEPSKQMGGGRRGVVVAFSLASRRRLMRLMACVRRDASLPVFVTLTYPNKFPSPKQSKLHLDTFIKRLKRAFPMAGGIWKIEPQQRGAPHYHILVWGCDAKSLKDFVPGAWFDIAGGGDELHLLFHQGKLKNQHCVGQVRSNKGVMAYASKYLGKTFEVSGWNSLEVGRFWGVFMNGNIPFGEMQTLEITRSQAVHLMRYQKRYAKLKKRSYPSLTVFCDAEQWITKVVSVEVSE